MDLSENLLTDRGAWTLENCGVANALEVIGNRIALLLVREALLGTTRFDDFARRIGVSEPATAKRLGELVSAGIMRRVPYRQTGQRARMEYRLTAKGFTLAPVIAALRAWGEQWLPGEPSFHAVHAGCGAAVHLEQRCERGHRVVHEQLALLAGPAP